MRNRHLVCNPRHNRTTRVTTTFLYPRCIAAPFRIIIRERADPPFGASLILNTQIEEYACT